MESNTLMEPTQIEELINYIEAFEFPRMELVELTKEDRRIIVDALRKVNTNEQA